MPEAYRWQFNKIDTMEKFELSFQKLEELNSNEEKKVMGGVINVNSIKESTLYASSKPQKPTTSNTGWFCGIQINIC